MYSYEDRIRAVRLYLELEQRVQKLRLEHDILNEANELLKKTRASIRAY